MTRIREEEEEVDVVEVISENWQQSVFSFKVNPVKQLKNK